MADIDTLAAADHITVVDPAPDRDGAPMWMLTHFDHGKRARDFVRHEDLLARLPELEAAGRVIGLSWEMHGRRVPSAWPGDWPTPTDHSEETG